MPQRHCFAVSRNALEAEENAGDMDTVSTANTSEVAAEHFEVLIVGAGISGIAGAYHLTHQCSDFSFVVLESKDTFGGTWVTHRYPGIRSDSDLYTFGYRFKPWTSAPIATAAEILKYMGEVIEENSLARHIRYRHLITSSFLVQRGEPVDDRGDTAGHGRGRALHCELPVDVSGVLSARGRLHAGLALHGGFRGTDRASAAMARGSRLRR